MNDRMTVKGGVRKVIFSLSNACRGLIYCFSTQRNMAIHAAVGIAVMAAAFILEVPKAEKIILLTAIAFVLAAETFNTALEKTIDLYTRERNELAHIAKDTAAGAVLLAAGFAVIAGVAILGPPLWKLLLIMLD